MKTRLLGLVLALAASGCAVDLPDPWEVRDLRLLGARVEVAGDPERPRPRLDEAFTVRQYLAVPGPVAAPSYDVAAAMCLAFRAPGGDLTCIGEQALAPSVQTVRDTEVTFGPLQLDLAAVNTAIAELAPPGTPAASLGPVALAQLATQFGVDRIAVFGAVCGSGRAERVEGTSLRADDPSKLFRCVGGEGETAEPNAFTLSVLVDFGRPFDGNRNPRFDCDPSTPSPCVDGIAAPGEARVPGPVVLARPAPEGAPRELVAWPALDPSEPLPWDGCASDPRLIKVPGGSGEHELRVRLDPSDREPYQFEIRQNGTLTLQSTRERVVIASAVSTERGELSRYLSTIFDDVADGDAETAIGYEPPPGLKNDGDEDVLIPASGLLARFYFLLRDQRGGVDATTRVLCLVPGAPGSAE